MIIFLWRNSSFDPLTVAVLAPQCQKNNTWHLT